MSSFRQFIWDPALLLSQMACIQAVFYTAESSLMLLYSVSGYEPYLSHIFSFQMLRSAAVIQLLAVLVCSYALSLVVQRAKQCLDFACTLHFFHFLISCIYNRAFPTSLAWWTIQIFGTIICTIVGEYLCMRVESQEIKLSGGPSKYDL